MADIIKPDLCVIGAGALGTGLATRARQAGLDVVLIRLPRDVDNDPTAGALHRAAFRASATRAQAFRTAPSVGLAGSEPKPNFRLLGERAAAIADAVAPCDTDERLRALGIMVLAEPAAFIDRQALRCGETVIRARHFALASGGRPLIPDLPGLDQVGFFTPRSIGENLRKLSHLVVIGGTPEAFELAQAYRRLGSMVTLVPQGGLLPGFDPELVAILLRDLREEGLVITEDATITAVTPRSQGTGIVLATAGGEDHLDVSHILVAMGDMPDLDEALLGPARLKPNPARPDHLLLGPGGQTSNARVTALGGAAGITQSQSAIQQAARLVDRLTGRGGSDAAFAPLMVMTEPALAQLGPLDPAGPLRPGQQVLRTNLAENAAARANGPAHGLAKVVTDANGRVAAAGAVGPGAGEVMALLAIALPQGLRLDALARLALPQPSAAAALVDLADQSLAGRPPRTGLQRLPWLRKFSS